MRTSHSKTGRPQVLPPSYGAASGLLFSRKREARRFSPMPFVVFVILVVLLVLSWC
jgi:hypothetical protein